MQGNSVFAIVGDASREVLLCNCHLQVVEPCMNNSLIRRRVVCLGMFVFFVFACLRLFCFVAFCVFGCFFGFICLTRSNKPNTTSQLASWCKKVVVEVVSSMSVKVKEVVRGK